MLKRILLPLVVAVLASATLPAQSAGRVDVNSTTKNGDMWLYKNGGKGMGIYTGYNIKNKFNY